MRKFVELHKEKLFISISFIIPCIQTIVSISVVFSSKGLYFTNLNYKLYQTSP